jgi:hypothetical protein
MRILLGTYDVCGWLSNLGRAFTELGHEVTTAVSEPPLYIRQSYDVFLPELAGGRPLNEIRPSEGGLHRLVGWMDRNHRQWKYTRSVHSLISRHDLVVKMWHPFIPSARENDFAKSKGIRLVQLFVGSDARHMPAFRQQYDVSQWDFPFDSDIDPVYQLSNIRQAEKHADLVYSVPDQAGLQLRPYFHLQAPLQVGNFPYSIPGRDVPRIVHAPSVPWKKGTDIVESAMEALRSEGLDFEFISLREVPQCTLLQILLDADILVDEIVCHGPGALSIEAMLSGCAVATRYLEDSPECFRPPVWSIQADNIIPRLRQLITDKQMVRRLAEEGRAYALRHNDARRIAAQMLVDLESPREPDYQPRFLRDQYIPKSESETRMINEWTAKVRHCDWYLREIAPGIRSGLVF